MSNLTEALELIAWFDECDGFRQGTDAPHKWVLQADSELRRLSEQVEKLTKERDELHRAFNQPVPRSEWEKMQAQLAALAEQNEKMRKVLLRLACLGNGDQYGNSIGNCVAQEALSLPNLATPPVSEDRKDAERLNWLDEQGMIAIGHKGCGEYRYYAGDLFPAIRQVIDQARQEDKP